MGAVHGAREPPPPRRTRPLSYLPTLHLLAPPQVHLKYVAASALCSVCAYHAGPDGERIMPLRSLLVYSAATHGLFAGLFVARVGMGILGNSRICGAMGALLLEARWPLDSAAGWLTLSQAVPT